MDSFHYLRRSFLGVLFIKIIMLLCYTYLYTTMVVSNYVASAGSMGCILYLHYMFLAVTNGWIGGRLTSLKTRFNPTSILALII